MGSRLDGREPSQRSPDRPHHDRIVSGALWDGYRVAAYCESILAKQGRTTDTEGVTQSAYQRLPGSHGDEDYHESTRTETPDETSATAPDRSEVREAAEYHARLQDVDLDRYSLEIDLIGA